MMNGIMPVVPLAGSWGQGNGGESAVFACSYFFVQGIEMSFAVKMFLEVLFRRFNVFEVFRLL